MNENDVYMELQEAMKKILKLDGEAIYKEPIMKKMLNELTYGDTFGGWDTFRVNQEIKKFLKVYETWVLLGRIPLTLENLQDK